MGGFLPDMFDVGVRGGGQGVFLLDQSSGMLRCREGLFGSFIEGLGSFRLLRGFSHSWLMGGGRLLSSLV